MTASERIWLTTREAHGKDLPPEKWADPNTTQLITTYILATPAALAASPEVQALVEAETAARKAAEAQVAKLVEAGAAWQAFKDATLVDDHWSAVARLDAALSAVKREAGE